MNRLFTIYCHTHVASGRSYVGQTCRTMETRWQQHACDAQKERGGCRRFRRAIRKYGPDSFTHRVLQRVRTQHAAKIAERRWIAKLRTQHPLGFNLSPGGNVGPVGFAVAYQVCAYGTN